MLMILAIIIYTKIYILKHVKLYKGNLCIFLSAYSSSFSVFNKYTTSDFKVSGNVINANL